MTEPQLGVLLVDDEPAITEVYESWLSEYEPFVAHGGPEALSLLERRADEIDVVFLDRKMPEMSGDAVLEAIRDREFDCQVAMITAVAPGYDIVDMPFDEYATKPVDRDDLIEILDSLRKRNEYADSLSRYYSLVAKHVALTAERPSRELRENKAFAELETEIREVERGLDDSVDLDDHREFQFLLREIS